MAKPRPFRPSRTGSLQRFWTTCARMRPPPTSQPGTQATGVPHRHRPPDRRGTFGGVASAGLAPRAAHMPDPIRPSPTQRHRTMRRLRRQQNRGQRESRYRSHPHHRGSASADLADVPARRRWSRSRIEHFPRRLKELSPPRRCASCWSCSLGSAAGCGWPLPGLIIPAAATTAAAINLPDLSVFAAALGLLLTGYLTSPRRDPGVDGRRCPVDRRHSGSGRAAAVLCWGLPGTLASSSVWTIAVLTTPVSPDGPPTSCGRRQVPPSPWPCRPPRLLPAAHASRRLRRDAYRDPRRSAALHH